MNATRSRKFKRKQKFPPGWNEKRIREVIAYYENQTEDEQLAEHEEAHRGAGITVMAIPSKLVPEVRKLILRHGA